MEGQSGCLRTSIAHVLSLSNEGCHARYGHNMTVVLLDHGGKEFPHEMKVRKDVDVEDPFCLFGRLVHYQHAVSSAGIVD